MDVHPTGDWSADACRTVVRESTASLDLGGYGEEVAQTLVAMHFGVYRLGAQVEAVEGRPFTASPQHLLAQLHAFEAILQHERACREDQQRFRLVGLDKLAETVVEVESLQTSLSSKRTQLEQMNTDANERLQRMVHDQQAAETRREASLALQVSLKEQEAAVALQRRQVLEQLADAEPAVLDAQAAVSSIKKQYLSEIRSMTNPPAAVKNTMESVCILLGHHIDGWKSVQTIIRRDDFIASVLHLDTEQAVPSDVRQRLQREYLSRPEYNYETINHASQACGPLARWVLAQVHYAETLDRVAPLRAQVTAIEVEAQLTKDEAAAAAAAVAELETSIAAYKQEYAALIRDSQAMTSKMEQIQQKVSRSTQLLTGLSTERARWEEGRAAFDGQATTLVGDCILCAATVAYAGFFDQGSRETLRGEWEALLRHAAIPFRAGLDVGSMLVSTDTLAAWHAFGLPDDALADENAAIMEHCTRYPLLLDPTGAASAYVQHRFAQDKLAVASCLDANFVKVLESALRFGTPLLLEDAEHMDPVLLPILKKERQRKGGRVLVRVAQQDVDFAPTFRLVLATRDPSIALAPALFCHVQMVNFATTPKSLQSQALHRILLAESPDMEAQRAATAQSQSTLHRRLASLEHDLLTALNEAEGNLLESDSVIASLETLKREAAEIQVAMAEVDERAAEVQRAIQVYEPLAEACSAVYFALQELGTLQPYYQWDLRFFWSLFDTVLATPSTDTRTADLHRALLQHTYRRVAPSLLQEDRMVLMIRLARMHDDSMELEALVHADAIPSTLPYARRIALDVEQRAEVWAAYKAHAAPELVPTPLEAANETDDAQRLVRRALVVRTVRPDRTAPALWHALDALLCFSHLDEPLDLGGMVDATPAMVPLLLASTPGHDASDRVEQLASERNVPCAQIALGAPSAVREAERLLANAARSGHWVLIQNAHLAMPWLAQLVSRLEAAQSVGSMRVLVTCELSAHLPRALLRAAQVLVYETPAGLQAAMLACLRLVHTHPTHTGPQERQRLYFLTAYLHAVLLERQRYVPLGWTVPYDFYDTDLLAALDMIDAWTARAAGTKAHLAPEQVPWDAIRTLLKEYVYGAKLDHATDRAVLDALVDRLFVPEAFDQGFVLAPDHDQPLEAPEATRMDGFLDWVRAWSEPQPTPWLFLAPYAERSVASAHAEQALRRAALVRPTAALQPERTSVSYGAAAEQARPFLAALPETVETEPPSDVALVALWKREQDAAIAWLAQVRTTLQSVLDAAERPALRTQGTAAYAQCLAQNRVPDDWRKDGLPTASLAVWIEALHARIGQAGRAPSVVALGRLFSPTAFLSATRQAAALALGTSWEQLHVSLRLGTHTGAGIVPIHGRSTYSPRFAARGRRVPAHGAGSERRAYVQSRGMCFAVVVGGGVRCVLARVCAARPRRVALPHRCRHRPWLE